MGKKERILSLNICVFWISLDYLRVCLLWKINAINLRFTTTKKVIYFSDKNEGEESTPHSNWICTLYIYLLDTSGFLFTYFNFIVFSRVWKHVDEVPNNMKSLRCISECHWCYLLALLWENIFLMLYLPKEKGGLKLHFRQMLALLIRESTKTIKRNCMYILRNFDKVVCTNEVIHKTRKRRKCHRWKLYVRQHNYVQLTCLHLWK